MAHLLLLSILYFLCLCSADGTDSSPTEGVTGPGNLVTDGTKNLTLTCFAASGVQYIWFTPGPDTNRCETGPQPSKVCTFQPKRKDDTKNVTCTVLGANSFTVLSAAYQVNLLYPPVSKPTILINRTQGPKEGDIKCTVHGGKPPVDKVNFHCPQSNNPDQPDHFSADGRNVSSALLIPTAPFKGNIRCKCTADWEPDSGLYLHAVYYTLNQAPTAQSHSLTVGAGVLLFSLVSLV